MRTLKVLWFILMVPSLLTSCAVAIYDEQFCSPIPGGLGAVCDNFLTSNQQILTPDEWNALQSKWVAAGEATECTESKTLGDIKAEIEELCSKTPCNYEVQQAITKGLEKIQSLGKIN